MDQDLVRPKGTSEGGEGNAQTLPSAQQDVSHFMDNFLPGPQV